MPPFEVLDATHKKVLDGWHAMVVNMAGGEIVPAAQRCVVDCAEWVGGGVEDLRLG